MSTTTAAAAPAAEKLDFKKVFPIFIIILIDLLGLTIIIPLLPLYAASFGASASLIGVLGGVGFLGEPLGWQEIAAALLILGAVGSVSLKR